MARHAGEVQRRETKRVIFFIFVFVIVVIILRLDGAQILADAQFAQVRQQHLDEVSVTMKSGTVDYG